MWLLKGNERASSDVTTQQWSKYAHLKNNSKWNLFLIIKKGGMPLHEMQQFPFKFPCNHSYMKVW